MSLTPITWTSLVNAAASPNSNDLIKTLHDGSDGFNAGAISTQTLVAATEGLGLSFSFVYGSPVPNLDAVCGLASTNPDQGYTSMEFAVRASFGQVRVYESGTLVYTGAGLLGTDVISLVFTGGKVDYRLNGVSFFTSSATPTFPLFAKGSIRTWYEPSGISNVNIIQLPIAPTLLTSSCVSGIGESVLPNAPIASFIADVYSGTTPLTVNFTDTSLNTPTTWLWEFGDGATSTSQNPSHVFPEGIYSVRLTATNAYGSSLYLSTIISLAVPVITIPAGGTVCPAGFCPPGITVDSTLGKIAYYVVDTANNQIRAYGPDGTLLATFGSVGSTNGKFFMPTIGSVVNGR